MYKCSTVIWVEIQGATSMITVAEAIQIVKNRPSGCLPFKLR